MKPPPFDLVRPESEEALTAALSEHGGEARLLAGGQSLVPMLNFRIVAPAVLVDLNGISSLSFVRPTESGIEIGAMTRHSQVEDSELIGARCALLRKAVGYVAHRAVRNRGTIGGSLALAYPGAEMPLALTALGAEVELRSARGSRVLPIAGFILGALGTALEEDEYLQAIRVPALCTATRSSFVEVSRRHGDYALAAAAALVERSPRGDLVSVRAAVSGGTGAPQSVAGLEALASESGRRLADGAREAVADLEVHGDSHYPEDYRRHLLGTVLGRALAEAAGATEALRAG